MYTAGAVVCNKRLEVPEFNGGIVATTAFAVVSEVGVHIARSPGDKHLASWLGLCPGKRSPAARR